MSRPEDRTLSRPDAVNVAHLVERCRVLGPGERFALWVQGCPLRCPGCHNLDFLPFVDAMWITIGELERRILATTGIEGVTFVGGEPFAQARALGILAQRIRRAGLSVMVYSGYTVEQLVSGVEPDAMWLLYSTDLVMDGPYRRELPTQRPWRGSDNQRLIALSQRYADRVEEWNRPVGQDFEVRVRADGTLEVLGIPPAALSAREGTAWPDVCDGGRQGPGTGTVRTGGQFNRFMPPCEED
ncbi:MAG: 4Fe-4S single cluster domain-containing protein [Planctomycetota bacterium]|nr:4Fe-4S single cluster domain-containing protein [Planctomycetota bacterium]